MSGRSALNPYGGLPLLTDRLIGDAYPKLEAIYDNMDMLTAVAAAITGTTIGAPLLIQRGVLQNGNTAALGATVTIDFPDLDIELAGILSSHVKLIGNDGALYFEGSETFTYKVTTNGLVLTVKAGAPAALANALVQWFIIYGVPAE